MNNNTEAPLESVNSLVLDAIRQLLSPAVLDMAIAFAMEMLRDAGVDHRGDVDRAEETLKELDVEAGRVTALTAAGLGDLPAVIDRLKAIQSQRETMAFAAPVPWRDRVEPNAQA